MLTAIAGLALGLLVIYFDRLSWDKPDRTFALTGAFLFWVAVIATQTMLWTLAAPPLATILRRRWRHRAARSVRNEVLPSALILTSLVAILVTVPRRLAQLPPVLPHRALKIDILSALALLISLTAATSIWLIRGRAEELLKSSTFTRGDLRTYLQLRSDLELLLAFLGAVIGLAIFASAALRNVVLLKDKNADFSASSIILYGFVLSFLVAIVYLPTLLALRQTGGYLRDRIEPLPSPNDENLNANLQRRNTFDELLGLKTSTITTFRAGVAILTPLLGSLTSLIPKLGG